jgi:hypothetical protein
VVEVGTIMARWGEVGLKLAGYRPVLVGMRVVVGLGVDYQRLGRQLCNIPEGGGSVYGVGEFRASLCGEAQVSMGNIQEVF